MANEKSVEMRAFNFASRTFAYRTLDQGLSNSVSAFSSLWREHLDPLVKADQYAQYVNDIGIATISPEQLTTNLRSVFKCIQHAGLKLFMAKCHFGTKKVDFLGRTTAPNVVIPLKQKITHFSEKFKFPRSRKAVQRNIGFLNYYRNYIPRLAEKLNPFFQLLKPTENKVNIFISTELMNKFRNINDPLDKGCQLALRQPLPDKQLIFMRDASFQAAGYARPPEDKPDQNITSTRKTFAPVAYGWKTHTPS